MCQCVVLSVGCQKCGKCGSGVNILGSRGASPVARDSGVLQAANMLMHHNSADVVSVS